MIILDDDDDESDEDENESESEEASEIHYDGSLPSQHRYLGTDLNELSGRIVLDESSYVNLPLLSFHNIVLLPGQTLPLQLEHPSYVSMMKNIIDRERTFGLVTTFDKTLGTTAEIRSYGEERMPNDEGLSVLKVKAEGRQRFKVVQTWRQVDGILMGKVQILPEIELSSPLNVRIFSNVQKTLPACTYWNRWVYELYDPDILMKKIKVYLKNWIKLGHDYSPNLAPSKPFEFSYWVAATLPLDDKLKLELLGINCSIQRLRWELNLLQKYSYLGCSHCHKHICDITDIFSMSVHGPQGIYVNPSGTVHDMLTLTTVKNENLSYYGMASTEHTWFPGYAWRICNCNTCHQHMGWKFIATNKKSKPKAFWGITRGAVKPRFKVEKE